MIKINDYATKNHLNEWEIKELPEGDYRLDLPNGDLTLLYLSIIKIEKCHLFCPVLPNYHNSIYAQINHILHARGIVLHTLESSNTFNATGSSLNLNQVFIQNITPDWSKYIAKDNAVLFLSEEDYNKYKDLYPENYPSEGKMFNKNQKFFIKNDKIPHLIKRVPSPICEWGDYTKVSIILPSIHSKNIQEISNIAKDLKENYGVEYVEVIATHCYLKENKFVKYDYTGGYKGEASFRYNNIDKIITTDSTGDLEVQDCANFKVIDCEEFFTNFLQNDKS